MYYLITPTFFSYKNVRNYKNRYISFLTIVDITMTDLKDKIAIVTGASSGIGAAVVKELLRSGMKVVGLGRRKGNIEDISKTCKDYAEKLFALETDITKEEDILTAFAWTERNVGPIHVVVNCAGYCCISLLTRFETDSLKRVLDTNLVAVALITREAVKSMQANKIDGTIVNIGSLCGYDVPDVAGVTMYVASKFGVRGFTEAIREELTTSGSKIRITNLSPGLVATEMTTALTSKHIHIQPENIASGVKYVLTQPPDVNVSELKIRPVLGDI